MFVIVIYSGERTAIFLFLLTLFFLTIFNIRQWKLYLIVIFIICSIFFIITKKETLVKNRVIINTLSQISLSENYLPKKIFSQTHEWHYIIAFRMFKDNPFFGQGVNSFRDNCFREEFRIDEKNSGCSTHPHNIYLQTLAEIGLFGFIFLFSAFIFIFYKMLKIILLRNAKKYNYNYHLFLLTLSIGLSLYPFIPTGNFFNNWMLLIFSLPIGFLLKKLIK